MSFGFKGFKKNNAVEKNDTELEEIMAEIDSLERQLSLEERDLHRPIKKQMSLQEAIDAELLMAMEEVNEEVNEEISKVINEEASEAPTSTFSETETQTTPKVAVIEAMVLETITPFDKQELEDTTSSHQESYVPGEISKKIISLKEKRESSAASPTSSPVSFVESKVTGDVHFSFNLTLGESEVAVQIDTTNGIEIFAEDVEISINETQGCVISIKNGMNFTIPLSIEKNSLKKKAA